MSEFVQAFLRAHVPDKDVADVENMVAAHAIVMTKRARPRRTAPRLRCRKGCLTHKSRRQLGLNRLLPMKAQYEQYLPLNRLWTQYITDYLSNYIHASPPFRAEPSDVRTANFLVLLNKCDLHGAILSVSESRCRSLIGLAGIVLVETKNSFHLLTKQNQLKLIPKVNTVFRVALDQFTIVLYGSRLLQRPSVRGYKKPPPYKTIQI